MRSPCFHSNLPERHDVQNAVAGVVSKAQATIAGTVFYTQCDPTSYRTGLYAKTANRPARVLVSDLYKSVRGSVAVSPDGRYLAWVDNDTNDDFAKLMVSDIDAHNAREVASGPNQHGLCNNPAWSPDSRRILLLQSGSTGTAGGLWASIDVESGQKTMLAAPTGCYPVWSPDGQWIAWFDGQAEPPNSSTIRITDTMGGNSRFIPYIQGVKDFCADSAGALSPGGRLALVDTPIPDQRACGDGPSSYVRSGLVVDTTTGNSVQTVITRPLGNGTFLADGSLLVLPTAGREFILLNPQQQIIAQFPESSLGDDVVVLAYVPN